MGKVNVEVVVSEPPCSTSLLVLRMLKEINEELKDDVELKIYSYLDERAKALNVRTTPRVFVGGEALPSRRPSKTEVMRAIEVKLKKVSA
jgi:glutaredoxin